jgi:molybdenum cofactor synthesis domain-containing protein
MSEVMTDVRRFVVATVARGRASVNDDVAQIVVDEVNATKVAFVSSIKVNRLIRSVTVNREAQYIEHLVVQIANGNEADILILIGGVGIGPRDYTCEVVDRLVHHRIEGFGEAFRRMMREDLNTGPEALLARATAGIYHQCVVVALPRQPEPLRRAMQTLVIPIADVAVRTAVGAHLSATS